MWQRRGDHCTRNYREWRCDERTDGGSSNNKRHETRRNDGRSRNDSGSDRRDACRDDYRRYGCSGGGRHYGPGSESSYPNQPHIARNLEAR